MTFFPALLRDNDLSFLVLSFLHPKEVASKRINKGWEKQANSERIWLIYCRRLLPGYVHAEKVHPKEIYKKWEPKVFGKEFYQKHELEIEDPPPITQNLLKTADYLIYIPPNFLVEQNRASLPNTLINFNKLCLTKGPSPHLDEESDLHLLKQKGNKAVKGRWSGQKEELIGCGLTYAQQKMLAQELNLKIVPLIGRVFLNFLLRIRYNKLLDTDAARTSTFFQDSMQTKWCATVGWEADKRGNFHLMLNDSRRFHLLEKPIGVAVEVPAL